MVLPSSKLANIQTCYFYKPASSKLKTVAKNMLPASQTNNDLYLHIHMPKHT